MKIRLEKLGWMHLDDHGTPRIGCRARSRPAATVLDTHTRNHTQAADPPARITITAARSNRSRKPIPRCPVVIADRHADALSHHVGLDYSILPRRPARLKIVAG
jgi:hypothetical protein